MSQQRIPRFTVFDKFDVDDSISMSMQIFFQLVIENENVFESQKIPVRFKNDDLLNRVCIQLKFSSNFVMNSDFHKIRVLLRTSIK